jgi:hypothetical protein
VKSQSPKMSKGNEQYLICIKHKDRLYLPEQLRINFISKVIPETIESQTG